MPYKHLSLFVSISSTMSVIFFEKRLYYIKDLFFLQALTIRIRGKNNKILRSCKKIPFPLCPFRTFPSWNKKNRRLCCQKILSPLYSKSPVRSDITISYYDTFIILETAPCLYSGPAWIGKNSPLTNHLSTVQILPDNFFHQPFLIHGKIFGSRCLFLLLSGCCNLL